MVHFFRCQFNFFIPFMHWAWHLAYSVWKPSKNKLYTSKWAVLRLTFINICLCDLCILTSIFCTCGLCSQPDPGQCTLTFICLLISFSYIQGMACTLLLRKLVHITNGWLHISCYQWGTQDLECTCTCTLAVRDEKILADLGISEWLKLDKMQVNCPYRQNRLNLES